MELQVHTGPGEQESSAFAQAVRRVANWTEEGRVKIRFPPSFGSDPSGV